MPDELFPQCFDEFRIRDLDERLSLVDQVLTESGVAVVLLRGHEVSVAVVHLTLLYHALLVSSIDLYLIELPYVQDTVAQTIANSGQIGKGLIVRVSAQELHVKYFHSGISSIPFNTLHIWPGTEASY